MSITIKSTHKLNIGPYEVDLTTEELRELQEQIDSALSNSPRSDFKEYWLRYSKELKPLNDWSIPPITSDEDPNKFWMGASTSKCGPVNSAQTHIQP